MTEPTGERDEYDVAAEKLLPCINDSIGFVPCRSKEHLKECAAHYRPTIALNLRSPAAQKREEGRREGLEEAVQVLEEFADIVTIETIRALLSGEGEDKR